MHNRHRAVRRPYCIIVMIAVTGLAVPRDVEATPESRAAALFLLISPSTRINGMGQAGVAVCDEPGGYYNPGTAAMAGVGHGIQARFYLTGMDWLPDLSDDMSYRYTSLQVGTQSKTPWQVAGTATQLRAVLFGYRTKLDLGQQTRTSERGEVLGTFSSADYADHLGMSVALLSLVDVGFGGTAKRINTDLGEPEASTNAYDYGMAVRVPLVRLLQSTTGVSLTMQQHLQPLAELTYGLAWQNRGSNLLDYGDAYGADPLPANRRSGWSAKLGLRWESEGLALELISARFTEETYRPQIEGAAASSDVDDSKSGVEFSLMDSFEYRSGEYDDIDGDFHLDTHGYTLRSDGLFGALRRLMGPAGQSSKKAALHYLMEHLSISWTRFKYDDDSGSLFTGRSHAQFGVDF